MSDYDYELPEELIAQTPLENRSDSRLLVLERTSGAITHSSFASLGTFLEPHDLLVFNDSRVIPARLRIRRSTGGVGELLLLERDAERELWIALGRPARRLRDGERVEVVPQSPDAVEPGNAEIVGRDDAGLLRVRLGAEVEANLDTYGAVPLPPYITSELDDRQRYQTVYARSPGSAAAPTAGLHFTDTFIEELHAAGVRTTFVTLHVGLDTFRPVSAEYAEDHEIHSEWCEVPAEAASAIEGTRQAGGRILPVGTTSARTLETFGQALEQGHRGTFAGPTSIYITPGYRWRLVDGLITNFHLPKSTLLLMVSALAGREQIMRAYDAAIAERYRFFSFGDAMLII